MGATTFDWLLLAVLWVIFAALLIGVRRLAVWRIGNFAGRTANQVDDVIAGLVRKTRVYFLVALALYLAIQFPEMPGRLVFWVGRITFVLAMIQVILWGNSLITHFIDRYKAQKLETDAGAVTTIQATGVLIKVLLWVVVVLLVLANFGVEIAPLIAGLGVGGIAVALAVQNILGDLFASLSIVLDKPFVVGDFLVIDQFSGTVEYTGLKTTRMRSLSGEQIIFSNGDLLQSRIRNYKRMYERRIVFTIRVPYNATHEQLSEIPGLLRRIVESKNPVRFDRAHFKEFGESGFVFEVVYFVLVPDYNKYMDIQQAINLEIYQELQKIGVGFALPTQKLHIESLPEGVERKQTNYGENA